MIVRAFGKLTAVFLSAIAGLFILAITCRGDACRSVVSSVLSEIREEPTGNIVLEEPLKNAVVESPFTVRGFARVFDGTVYYELTDTLGTVIAQGALYTEAENEQVLLPFQGSILYSPPRSPVGKLTLFDRSTKDDRIIDAISVSLIFTGAGESTAPSQDE